MRFFSVNGVEVNGYGYNKKTTLTLSAPHEQNYLEMNHKAHVKARTIKSLKGNVREHLYDLGVSKDPLNKTRKSLSIKLIIDISDLTKNLNLPCSKSTAKKLKRQWTDREKMSVLYPSAKSLDQDI